MIIPVTCRCGKVLGNLYEGYKKRVVELKKKEGKETKSNIININAENVEKTVEGRVLDEMGCIRDCCRCVMLAHIDFV